MPSASNQRQQQEERRKQKLADIDEQVKAGRLTVRQMTPEERADQEARRKPAPRRR
jgi:hypothetical protein